MHAVGRASALVLAGVAAALTGCSSAPSPPPPAVPWPDRPVVDLHFEVADDLHSVTGRERVLFTPDQSTCDLVFRAWPNKPATASAGSSLVLAAAQVDGQPAAVRDEPAGAPRTAPAGTLQRIPLARCAQPGQRLTVDLSFQLILGERVDERVGASSAAQVAWFATAFPLLAWERHRGWNTDPAVPIAGEMASSEDFRLESLEVAVPARYQVSGTGEALGSSVGPGGTTVHRFTAPAVRDVAVTVGRLNQLDATVDGVRVHLASGSAPTEASLSAWLDQIRTSMRGLVHLLGPFPYQDLWITVLASESSGIEFPGAIQFADVDPHRRVGLVSHELAHMWFYGLVGNNQGRDPWLDESFATYAQMLVDGEDNPYSSLHRFPGEEVGAPMTYWSRFGRPTEAYDHAVYTLGPAALMEARDRSGHQAFDAALRAYLRANAYAIATPGDVRRAFAGLPAAIAVLEEVGALSASE